MVEFFMSLYETVASVRTAIVNEGMNIVFMLVVTPLVGIPTVWCARRSVYALLDYLDDLRDLTCPSKNGQNNRHV